MSSSAIWAAAARLDAPAVRTACTNPQLGLDMRHLSWKILVSVLHGCPTNYGAHFEKIMRQWIFGGKREDATIKSILPSLSVEGIQRLQGLLHAKLAANTSTLWPDTVLLADMRQVALDLCEPVLTTLLACTGHGRNARVGPLATVAAHIGSKLLLSQLKAQGLNLAAPNGPHATIFEWATSGVAMHPVQRLTTIQPPLVSLEWHSALHSAAWLGDFEVFDLLQREVPELHPLREPRSGLSAAQILPQLDRANASAAGNHTHTRGPVSTCDIDSVTGQYVHANPDGFLRKFISRRRPVIVRGMVKASPAFSRLAARLTRERLIAECGACQVAVGPSPYSDELHPANERAGQRMERLDAFLNSLGRLVRLQDGVERDPRHAYVFTTKICVSTSGTPLLTNMSIGDWIGRDGVPEWMAALQIGHPQHHKLFSACGAQFYVGAKGTGSAYHHHNAAWNILTSGRKRWSFLPPAQAAWSRLPLSEFHRRGHQRKLSERLGGHLALKCVQLEGDMVVVPEAWGHEVRNLASSIGVAQEFYH